MRCGSNHYQYVANNPLTVIDPMGLDKWDWNGVGDTAVGSYYDDMFKAHHKCDYYEDAAHICRGHSVSFDSDTFSAKGFIVNRAVELGTVTAWLTGSTNNSGAQVLEKIRTSLVAADKKARADGLEDPATGCVYGDEIDKYHDAAFQGAGLSRWAYGGNLWFQDVWPNPVPLDSR